MMNIGIPDKLLFAQMVVDGFERSTIMFFQRVLPGIRCVDTFTIAYIAQNGGYMTEAGCRRHLTVLLDKNYVCRIGRIDWKLVTPVLRDYDLVCIGRSYRTTADLRLSRVG